MVLQQQQPHGNAVVGASSGTTEDMNQSNNTDTFATTTTTTILPLNDKNSNNNDKTDNDNNNDNKNIDDATSFIMASSRHRALLNTRSVRSNRKSFAAYGGFNNCSTSSISIQSWAQESFAGNGGNGNNTTYSESFVSTDLTNSIDFLNDSSVIDDFTTPYQRRHGCATMNTGTTSNAVAGSTYGNQGNGNGTGHNATMEGGGPGSQNSPNECDTFADSNYNFSNDFDFDDDDEYEKDRNDATRRKEQILMDSLNLKSVRIVRNLILLCLVALTTLCTMGTYTFFSKLNNQHIRYQQHLLYKQFTYDASNIISSTQINMDTILFYMDLLAMNISKETISTYEYGANITNNTTNSYHENKMWPFITIPDFDDMTDKFLYRTQSKSVTLLPLVRYDLREMWETYSVQQHQSTTLSNITNTNSRPYIYHEETGMKTNESSIYFPYWQTSQHSQSGDTTNSSGVNNMSHYNLDAFSQSQYKGSFRAIYWYKNDAVLTPADIDTNLQEFDNNDENSASVDQTENDRVYSRILYPIYYDPKRNNYNTNKTNTLVAVLMSTHEWSTILLGSGVRPTNHASATTRPIGGTIDVVIENTFNQSFQYQISSLKNDGNNNNNENSVKYMGTGKHRTDSTNQFLDDIGFVSVTLRSGQRRNQSSSSVAGLMPKRNDKNFFRGISSLNTDYSTYTINVYPTMEMYDQFMANAATYHPTLYSFFVILSFMIAAGLFLWYDSSLERRQRTLTKQTVQCTAIVTSLFPERVHDRLLETSPAVAETLAASRHVSKANHNSIMDRTNNKHTVTQMLLQSSMHDSIPNTTMHSFACDDDPSCVLETQSVRDRIRNSQSSGNETSKMKLRSFLETSNGMDVDGVLQAKPIADFFPHCTVMFTDMVGFTAWSSSREPTQVFILLQNIFHEFDMAATRRDVFKVETIGDGYVAVTGLPEPQDDHAIIMVGFALECRRLMRTVTRSLEKSLGPETGDLSMRIGLHSGPVTAGVLRGDKSRFQLFGDTVNTAAHLESTGRPNHIHISSTTAALLKAAGKDERLIEREDPVMVKGKGEMKTYWFQTSKLKKGRRSRGIASAFKSFNRSIDFDISNKEEEDIPQPKTRIENVPERHQLKHQRSMVWGKANASTTSLDSSTAISSHQTSVDPTSRLIDWNVQLLQGLLKQVVARRQALQRSDYRGNAAAEKRVSKEDQIVFLAENVSKGSTVLDEVAEIITLPSFNANEFAGAVDPESFELDDNVVGQLREYVQVIANTYRDNPFHNYEHACHVQMTMMKLLQRVVTPEDIGYDGGSTGFASDAHNYTYGITSDPLTQFTVVLCGLLHDCDHCGVPNGQLVKENAHIATLYQGKCVAEQNSIDLAWNLLMDPDYEALRECIYTNEDEFRRFRQLVVNIVLATDIFDKDLSELRKSRWNKAFTEEILDETPVVDANRKATIVLEHLIQASDVSHTMQHWDIYRKWNERLFYEMQLSFKSGRTETDPASGWYKGELWFFDNYIIPLAKKLKDCRVFGVSSEECLKYAEENRALWESQGEKIVQDMSSIDYFSRYKSGKPNKRTRRVKRKNAFSLHLSNTELSVGDLKN